MFCSHKTLSEKVKMSEFIKSGSKQDCAFRKIIVMSYALNNSFLPSTKEKDFFTNPLWLHCTLKAGHLKENLSASVIDALVEKSNIPRTSIYINIVRLFKDIMEGAKLVFVILFVSVVLILFSFCFCWRLFKALDRMEKSLEENMLTSYSRGTEIPLLQIGAENRMNGNNNARAI